MTRAEWSPVYLSEAFDSPRSIHVELGAKKTSNYW